MHILAHRLGSLIRVSRTRSERAGVALSSGGLGGGEGAPAPRMLLSGVRDAAVGCGLSLVSLQVHVRNDTCLCALAVGFKSESECASAPLTSQRQPAQVALLVRAEHCSTVHEQLSRAAGGCDDGDEEDDEETDEGSASARATPLMSV